MGEDDCTDGEESNHTKSKSSSTMVGVGLSVDSGRPDLVGRLQNLSPGRQKLMTKYFTLNEGESWPLLSEYFAVALAFAALGALIRETNVVKKKELSGESEENGYRGPPKLRRMALEVMLKEAMERLRGLAFKTQTLEERVREKGALEAAFQRERIELSKRATSAEARVAEKVAAQAAAEAAWAVEREELKKTVVEADAQRGYFFKRVAESESRVAELQQVRAEDGKANAKLVAIYASREQGWKSEKSKLMQEIDGLRERLRKLGGQVKAMAVHCENQMGSEARIRNLRRRGGTDLPREKLSPNERLHPGRDISVLTVDESSKSEACSKVNVHIYESCDKPVAVEVGDQAVVLEEVAMPESIAQQQEMEAELANILQRVGMLKKRGCVGTMVSDSVTKTVDVVSSTNPRRKALVQESSDDNVKDVRVVTEAICELEQADTGPQSGYASSRTVWDQEIPSFTERKGADGVEETSSLLADGTSKQELHVGVMCNVQEGTKPRYAVLSGGDCLFEEVGDVIIIPSDIFKNSNGEILPVIEGANPDEEKDFISPDVDIVTPEEPGQNCSDGVALVAKVVTPLPSDAADIVDESSPRDPGHDAADSSVLPQGSLEVPGYFWEDDISPQGDVISPKDTRVEFSNDTRGCQEASNIRSQDSVEEHINGDLLQGAAISTPDNTMKEVMGCVPPYFGEEATSDIKVLSEECVTPGSDILPKCDLIFPELFEEEFTDGCLPLSDLMSPDSSGKQASDYMVVFPKESQEVPSDALIAETCKEETIHSVLPQNVMLSPDTNEEQDGDNMVPSNAINWDIDNINFLAVSDMINAGSARDDMVVCSQENEEPPSDELISEPYTMETISSASDVINAGSARDDMHVCSQENEEPPSDELISGLYTMETISSASDVINAGSARDDMVVCSQENEEPPSDDVISEPYKEETISSVLLPAHALKSDNYEEQERDDIVVLSQEKEEVYGNDITLDINDNSPGVAGHKAAEDITVLPQAIGGKPSNSNNISDEGSGKEGREDITMIEGEAAFPRANYLSDDDLLPENVGISPEDRVSSNAIDPGVNAIMPEYDKGTLAGPNDAVALGTDDIVEVNGSGDVITTPAAVLLSREIFPDTAEMSHVPEPSKDEEISHEVDVGIGVCNQMPHLA